MGKFDLNDKLTYAYVRNIKRWMFCPVCGAKMHIYRKTSTWKCGECNYILSDKEFRAGYVFWFCDNCKSFLNNQQGFDLNKKKWLCVQCGHENDLTACNIVNICKNCGKKLPEDSKYLLCDDCRTNRNRRVIQIGAIGVGVGTFFGLVFFNRRNSDNFTRTDFINNSIDDGTEDTDYPICKSCGAKMTDFDGWAWYTCPECGDSVRISDDGTTTWQNEIFGRLAYSGTGRTCKNCGFSLSEGDYIMPWENGSNPDGYVKCPHCGCVNFQWEDDD